MSKVLSTGEAAKICGVNFRTVIRWIERGLLTSYRLPGRGDHRVTMEELQRFMRENGIPDQSQQVELARRILIAEDESSMAHAIERVLKFAGYETRIASNGFEAGAMLHDFKPGLITLDLRMPGIDGLQVLQFLQRAYLATPLKILVVSADVESRLQQALTLGADGVLPKPFSNEALLTAIANLYLDSAPPRIGRSNLSRNLS